MKQRCHLLTLFLFSLSFKKFSIALRRFKVKPKLKRILVKMKNPFGKSGNLLIVNFTAKRHFQANSKHVKTNV